MKIFVATYNKMVRTMICSMLESMGFTDILTADRGDIALDLLKQHGTDIGLVILGKFMYLMDGLEFVNAIRDNRIGRKIGQDLSSIPVLMLLPGGSAYLHDRLYALRGGVNKCLALPCSATDLESAITPLLKK